MKVVMSLSIFSQISDRETLLTLEPEELAGYFMERFLIFDNAKGTEPLHPIGPPRYHVVK
ncbi:MAG: hypothetical protein ACHBNF_00290 [Chromatiales bacterium]